MPRGSRTASERRRTRRRRTRRRGDERSGTRRAGEALAAAALVALVAAAPAVGQESSVEGLTVYMQDLAVVRSVVDWPLPEGERTLRVDGLPPRLQDASLTVADPGVRLLGVHGRRSYQSPGEGDATSLALDLRVDRSLERLRLAYLTGGMGWDADYDLLVAGDDRSARIGGYATLSNNSGATFRQVDVQLLAGTVDAGGRDRAFEAARASVAAAQEAPDISREAFSGYHLYEIDAPLTLRPGTSRRIRLLGADSVRVDRQYVLQGEVQAYRSTDEPRRQEAIIRYRIERPEGTSFGDLPLPTGTVRVFQEDDDGRLQLLGTDRIANTPAGERVTVTVGRAFDIGGFRTQTSYEQTGPNVHESAWEVELSNRTDGDVVVRVLDRIGGEWEILESSHEARRLSASLVRFDVAVPADGEATLTYRVRVER